MSVTNAKRANGAEGVLSETFFPYADYFAGLMQSGDTPVGTEPVGTTGTEQALGWT